MSRPPSSGRCSEGLEKNWRVNKHKAADSHCFAAAGHGSRKVGDSATLRPGWVGWVIHSDVPLGNVSLQCGLVIGLRLWPEISGLSSKSQETCPSNFVTKIREPLGLGQVR